MLQKNDILPLIELAFEEDIATGDITAKAIFRDNDNSEARIIAKDNGIFCGKDVLCFVYEYLDAALSIHCHINDGDPVYNKQEIALITGPTMSLLAGERIVLNFIQRMTGIATYTNTFVKLVKGTAIDILDTRKTLPGFRMLDKYSVKTGGGRNHRMGLYDMVMIKDNHIKAAGSITNAVDLVSKAYGSKFQIEVETTTIDEVKEAVRAKADIIMLDNMDIPTMQQSINIIQKKSKVEISGNISEEKIKEIIANDLRIDFISIGALTHSVKAFDFSMKFN